MRKKKELPGWYRKADKIVVTAAKLFSYVGGAALFIVAVITSYDAFLTKVFRMPVQNVTDLVTYMNIPCVFTCIALVQLTMGHTHIDLLYKKAPKIVHTIIHMFGYVCGVVVCGFAGWRGFVLMAQKFQSMTHASTTTSFLIWPFVLFIGLGYSLLAIAFLWSIVREILGQGVYDIEPADLEAAEEPDSEEGEK